MAYAIIVLKPLMNGKTVREKPVLVFGLSALFYHILKLRPVVSAVVENPVKQNSYLPAVSMLHQLKKILFCTKSRINVKVVRCIIFVVGGSFENRSKIDACDSQ